MSINLRAESLAIEAFISEISSSLEALNGKSDEQCGGILIKNIHNDALQRSAKSPLTAARRNDTDPEENRPDWLLTVAIGRNPVQHGCVVWACLAALFRRSREPSRSFRTLSNTVLQISQEGSFFFYFLLHIFYVAFDSVEGAVSSQIERFGHREPGEA